MDVVEMILTVSDLIYKLYEMVETTKANKERCHRVAERVRILEQLVCTVKQRGPDHITDIVGKALNELWLSLLSAKELMMKFTKSKAVKNFALSKGNEERFLKINQRLTENIQVLSATLQVEQGNILQRVYETVSVNQNDMQPLGTAATPLTPPPMPTPLTPPPMPTPLTPPPMPTPLMPSTMPTPLPMTAYHPPTPIHAHCFMPPPVSVPSTFMPGPCFMSPVQVIRPMNPMPFTQNIAQIPFSPAVVRHYGPATAPMAPMPLVNSVTIMGVPSQNTSFASSVVNSFFR